jgi:hypothetical protein
MERLPDRASGTAVDDAASTSSAAPNLPLAFRGETRAPRIAPSMFEARLDGREDSPAQHVSVEPWCWPQVQSDGMSMKNRVRAAIPPVAHVQKYILPVAMVAIVPGFLFPQIGGLGALSSAVSVAWAVSMLAVFVHDRSTALCLRCLEEIPGDSPQRAQRRKLVLRFHHFTGLRVVLLVEVALFFAGPIVLIFALGLRDAGSLLMVLGVLWGFQLPVRRGSQLRPWCTYCRGWDGGGDCEPSPDPVTSGTKTVR